MTWEEKITAANAKAAELLGMSADHYQHASCRETKIFGSNGCCSSNIKSAVADAVTAMHQGELAVLQQKLPLVRKQLEVLQVVTKVYFAYPGEKCINYSVGVNKGGGASSCGVHVILAFKAGKLWLELPKFVLNVEYNKEMTNKMFVNKALLCLSRFVRDAEKRCLKHPRHKKV